MLLCTMFVSCTDFFGKFENYVVDLKFETTNYNVMVDGMVGLTMTADPSDSFLYYDAEFTSSDKSIADIVDVSGKQCFVKGYKKGSVIITGKLSNKEAKCIVNVN